MGTINIIDAAKRAGVTDKTLRRAIDAGTLVAQPRAHANQAVMIAAEDLANWMVSRQVPAQPTSVNDPGLVSRIAELEQTVQRMQEDYRNDQLLGGHDPLALGPADDAYTQNRIDTLVERIRDLDENKIAKILSMLNKEDARQDLDINKLIDRIVALEQAHLSAMKVISQQQREISEMQTALQETQDLPVERLNQPQYDDKFEQELQASRERTKHLVERELEKEQVETAQPTYEGEWTITTDGGRVDYHDTDAQRARRRLDFLLTNYRGKQWQLHPPHFTPSSGIATEITTDLPQGVHKRLVLSTGETIDFLDDFNHPPQHTVTHPSIHSGYSCKATHKDVETELTVYPHDANGNYTLTQTRWGKTSNVGREGPKQAKRAQYLLATLIDRTEREMRQAGWTISGDTGDASPHGPSKTLWKKAD